MSLPQHFCPGCGSGQRPFARYPWYFCRACTDSAVDGAGRALVFGNTAVSGGFGWRYADGAGDTALTECRGAVCLIRGRPALVHEARFGGIVAEPHAGATDMPEGFWRLTGPQPRPPWRPRREESREGGLAGGVRSRSSDA